MAFNNEVKAVRKNLFTARVVSKKTGAMVSWIHITDDFARKVFGCLTASEVTAEQAATALPALMDNDMVEIKITDLVADVAQVAATDY